jgi:hypothetical protein
VVFKREAVALDFTNPKIATANMAPKAMMAMMIESDMGKPFFG